MAFRLEVSSTHHNASPRLKLTPQAGQQDSTPRSWDVKYYSETQAKSPPRGVFRFDSDKNLANPSTESGKAFTEFAKDKGQLPRIPLSEAIHI